MTTQIEQLDNAIVMLEKQRNHLIMLSQINEVNRLYDLVHNAFVNCIFDEVPSSAFKDLAAGDFSIISLLGTTVPQALKVNADYYHVVLELETESGVVKFTGDVVEYHNGMIKLSALDITVNNNLIDSSLEIFRSVEVLIAKQLMHEPEQNKNSKSVFTETKMIEILNLISSSAIDPYDTKNLSNNIYPLNLPARTA